MWPVVHRQTVRCKHVIKSAAYRPAASEFGISMTDLVCRGGVGG
jgi:hypothetical protein